MEIRSFEEIPTEPIKKFTDQEIGMDYYSLDEIEVMKKKSMTPQGSASFGLVDGDEVLAIRISYPPGQWQKGKGQSLSPHLWPHPPEQTAYFQSLFVAKPMQNQGWGSKLSKMSLKILQKAGASGVVCHSWVESPGNSSQKYLLTLQFKSLCKYPRYWEQVDYICPRCGQPCLCTAEEMYRDLKENPL